MEKKHTPPTPQKDEAIFPIVVNSKPNMNKALKLAQHIMSKLKTSDEEAEYKEPVKHIPLKFKIIDNTKLLYIGFISDDKGNSFCKILRDEVKSKEEAIERAEFIVQACNNYESLQSENERMREFLEIEYNYNKELSEIAYTTTEKEAYEKKCELILSVLNSK